MFTARALQAADAHLAYPLVACRYPAVTLQRWTNYVRRTENGEVGEHLVCMVDARERRHAVFGYNVATLSPAARRLHVAHIATFRLIGDAIHRALHETLDRLASEHKCREVILEPWRPLGGAPDRAPLSQSAPSAARVLTIDFGLAPLGALN